MSSNKTDGRLHPRAPRAPPLAKRIALAPISANDGHAAITRPYTVGSTTGTFAPSMRRSRSEAEAMRGPAGDRRPRQRRWWSAGEGEVAEVGDAGGGPVDGATAASAPGRSGCGR